MNRSIHHRTAPILLLLSILLLVSVACSGESEPATTSANDRIAAPTATPAPSASAAPRSTATPLPTALTVATAAVKQPGAIVADWGFRPDKNGFAFENYSNAKKYQNLTPVEMQRIFGDVVCGSKAGGKCLLSPPVNKLMEQYNRAMAGGHCFGFSVLALRFAQNLANPADFGSKNVSDLKIEGNEKLQREIAYSYTFQFFDPVNEKLIQGTPNDVLDKLIAYFQTGHTITESYTLGFFNAKGGGGHAVTPYAVEDRGKGIYGVLIYDNNLPKTPREMLFDRNTNSWTYVASENPNLKSAQYYGNAQTQSLFLLPTTPGLAPQTCPVCAPQASGTTATKPLSFNAIFLHGDPRNHGHLLITDDRGRRYGYLPNGTFVREIPGATHTIVLGQGVENDLWNDAPEPIYYIPTGSKLVTLVSGSTLTRTAESAVVAIGPGYYVGIEGINLDPGQVDTLTIGSDGTELSYKTAADEAPDVVMGIETQGPDYAFSAKDLDMKGGGTLAVDLDAETGQLKAQLQDTDSPARYDLEISRINSFGEQVFTYNGIPIESGQTEFIEYGDWLSGTGFLEIGVDEGSDGTIDETNKYITGAAVEITPEPEETETEAPPTDVSETDTPTPEDSLDTETPTPEDSFDTETPTPEDSFDTETPTPEDSFDTETPTPEDSYYTETPTPEDSFDTETPTPEDSYSTETPTPEDSYYTETPTPEDYSGQETATPGDLYEQETPTPDNNEQVTPTEESALEYSLFLNLLGQIGLKWSGH